VVKNKEHRKQIKDINLDEAINSTTSMIHKRLFEKGKGTYASIHETLGIITEEYDELIDAVHNNDQAQVHKELKDIAVGCIIAMACINQGSMDW